MLRFLTFLPFLIALAWATKPMESIKNYNVILVHGAADMRSGLDCKNVPIKEAHEYDPTHDSVSIPTEYLGRIGGYEDLSWFWNENFHGGTLFQFGKESGATGMVNEFREWLTEDIFDNDKRAIYLQRPFTNPANSPFENGKEIGWSKWQGTKNCDVRRSLIEEAQEVKAKGRRKLDSLRKNVDLRDELPPSRNILIAHSMGGVASREYVQGDNYNNDVDKLIALDSPHKGTHALDGLIHMKGWIANPVKEAAIQGFMAALGFGLVMVALDGGPPSDYQSLMWIATGIVGVNALNAVTSFIMDLGLGYGYTYDDPLVPYIRPGSTALNKLNGKPYSDNLPMMRILSGRNGLTFGSNNEYAQNLVSLFVPDAIYTPVKNSIAQISHTEISNPAYINNIMASILLGIVGGFSLTDHGSSLIPHWSGAAEKVPALDNSNGNSKFYTFDANENMNNPTFIVLGITTALATMEIASKLGIFDKPLAEISRLTIAITAGAMVSAYMLPSAAAAGMDMNIGHRKPILKDYQKDWKGQKNSYSKILGGDTIIKPYQMEEFLYEKPFANIQVMSTYSKDWGDEKKDTLGLYVGDSLKPVYIAADKLLNPLTFKSSSDWETFGAKKVRWDNSVQGAGGNKVPIRHVDRYPMPSFMVEDFIQEYKFEIDDLMPHRLRQIRLNFNFNEEIAWECDISKADTSTTACVVYKRTPANDKWDSIKTEKHPVNKNGIFVFKPKEYYNKVGLGAIQKDNQNTVVISMVNKIGLSNSQRFYYLFKATADLVEPFWPLRNIKISKIDSFMAYASTLDYQGFEVLNGQERMTSSTGNMGISNLKDMYSPLKYGEGFLLRQNKLSNYSELPEGKYNWHVNVAAGNGSDTTKSEMFVPFTLDKTPPKISIDKERDVVNLDSVTFLARFKNEDTTGFDESLRMAAFFLKKNDTTKASVKFSNILATNFGISLSDFGKNAQELEDGEYEIVAYAFDGAVGSLEQYHLLNNVANGDSGKSVYDIIDNGTVQSGINFSKTKTKFFVDMQPPKIETFSLLRVSNGKKISKPGYSLAENQNELILNQDSLLKILINIFDSNGKNSAVARYSISFTDRNGGGSMQIGDTVTLSKGKGQKEWLEQGNMLIPDGDYNVSIKIWDEAGNTSDTTYRKILRIDRLPPSVVEVVSSKLTYNTSDDYSGKIYVEQKDKENHLSEMECHWRINGSNWNKIGKKLLKKAESQISTFEMDKEIVGTAQGKKHLEAGCMDWAGNFASALDLFHVGELSPIIAYPIDSIIIGESVVAIRGEAPKRSSDDSTASYMLEWRKAGDDAWQTNGIDVGAGKRSSDSSPWLSNDIQPNLGDLGYLYLGNFEAGNYYELKLSVRDCSACAWRSDVVSFYYWPQSDWGSGLDGLIFSASGGENGFIPGEDTLSLSLSATGSVGNDFRVSLYAKDSRGNSLFETHYDSLSVSPYEGKPASFDGDGIWFWSENETYNLQWKGLPSGKEITVLYTDGDINEDMCGMGCSFKDTLLNSNLEDIYKIASIQNEMRIPKGLDKAMLFSGSSGSIQFKNKKAFWLSADTLHIPIHLGKGGTALETVVNVNYFKNFQVNPSLYGLHHRWDGIASTGRYPQGDSIALYAEAVENRIGGMIFRDSLKVHIKKLDLSIKSGSSSLDDFYVVSYKGSDGADGEKLALGKKSISYGIIGRDAYVSAYIKNEKDDIVKTFFKDTLNTASHSDKSYTLSWDGVSDNEHLISDGKHYFHIVANEAYASEPQSTSLRLDFKISYSPGVVQVKDEPGVNSKSALSLIYADSVSNDYWQYAPIADYLVQANANGKTLPDSLRSLNVEWAASGTQSVYGYSPQRFSVAVKRQRETLPLVIVTKVVHYIETSKKCTYKWFKSDRGHYTDYIYNKHKVYFNGTRKSEFELSIDKGGLDDSDINSLTIYAFLLRHAEGKEAEDLLKTDSSLAVWKETIPLPKTNTSSSYDEEYFNPFTKEEINCSADILKGKQCIYTQEDTTEGYNPNANLFSAATFRPVNNKYYTDYKNLSCSDSPKRFSKLNFTVELEIPDSLYWNADYGIDNLVNRTIRLDQTNKTMYGKNGYLRLAADSLKNNTFYDGKNWHNNYNYGMLTPFEVHRFPFVSVDTISSNNAFAFPDETSIYKYPSYYQAKIYNHEDIFRAKIIGTKDRRGSKDTLTVELNNNADKKTPLLTHGSVEVLVSLNSAITADVSPDTIIPYPADSSTIKSTCPSISESWLDATASQADCKKYYNGGSKVHYAVGDFTNEQWNSAMTTNINGRTVIANINNSENPRSPFDKFGDQSGKSPCVASLKINSSNYDIANKRFYTKANCGSTPSEIKATYKPKIKGVAGSDTALFSFKNDTLYIIAQDWNDSSFWRHLDTTAHNWQDYPKHGSPQTLGIKSFFNDNWVKELKLTDAKLLHLDSSLHTHFKAEIKSDSNVILFAKNPPDSIRPSEFIAVKGKVPGSSDWRVSYLNRGILHSLASGRSEDSLLAWFNVNRLQGNTSILLQWGSGGVITNMRKLDLDIGSSVTLKEGGVVRSLFGEVSVTFPENAIATDTVVTVRTTNAKDYAFETLSGSALLGPVVEVLPSMTFIDTNALPRIKSRITKEELTDMKLSPDRVRLYKIDMENRKFVELQNTLIGFDVPDSVVLKCEPENYENCGYNNNNWSYLLISAETRTFSAFAILDKEVAEQFNRESDIVPDNPLPTEIVCKIPESTLWLGLDNGYLELPQECNQPAMGILQLRQSGNVMAEARQNTADTLRWDGRTGINKIAHGDYTSRYIAIGTTGQEMQTIGPVIYTDTLRPVISNWSVVESSVVLDREFKIQAKVHDDLSGFGSISLNWSLSEAISGTVYLNAGKDGNVDYTLYIPRNQLAQCAGCKLKITLRVEDKGHNWVEQEWQSGRLWPYPTNLALWYPALEGAGKTANEYTGTGHDLDLPMLDPWLSASGIYFKENGDKASGKGQVDLGRTDSYTLEAWIRPGYATSVWRRILGFSFADGKYVDLQVKDKDVRLLDGTEVWTVPDLLSQPKAWSHLAIAVDGNHARFYVDGKSAGVVASSSSERLWFGNFSLGMANANAPSFIGNLMQVRLYKRALAEEEIYAIFSGAGLGGGSRMEIALAGELYWEADGVERGFSCAVPGSAYWGTSKENTLSFKTWVEQGASYKIFLYARSAQPGDKTVKAGVSGNLISGTVSLESVWRPVALQGIALPLRAGFNDIQLRVPAGMDIAGIAISDNSGLLPSQISWKSGNSTSYSAVATQVRFDGHPDPSMIRPRIRLQNTSPSIIYGPKVRYYFRGEDPTQVQASKFYPQEGELVIRQEGDNLGYAEWSFPETTVLPSGQLLFWGEGPHFGLHNTNYVPWVVKDDPSFAEGSSNSFVDAPGIVVLDVDNRVLSGSCFENELPLKTTPIVQVLARDSRAKDNQASQLYIRLENIGQVPVRDYEVRYSFYVPGNVTPVLDVYDMQGLSASLKNLGSGRWQVVISGSASLGPGISWANPAQFALHLPNWQAGWNTGDDPSYEGISAEWALAKGIEVFDASGNRIYGKEPIWPVEIASQDNLIWGAELMTPSEMNNPVIGIARLPDGLLVTLLENSQLRLDLVNAAGIPQKFLYEGFLGAGERIIPVNWSNIDISKTYLVVRMNGKITTQLLSKLGN